MTETRTPARAAFEAFIAAHTSGMPGEIVDEARLNWSQLMEEGQLIWRDVANAVVSAGSGAPPVLHAGQRVAKTTGDYRFEGEVVIVFTKRSGAVRVVVENDDGLLLILNPEQLLTP